MKTKSLSTKKLLLILAFALLTFTACSNGAEPNSSEAATPPSSSSEAPRSSSSAASNPGSSQSQGTQTSETTIAIVPLSPIGTADAFYITDGTTQDKILNYLGDIQPIESVHDPITGGSFLELSITRQGSTTVYTLSNHNNTPNGHFRLSKEGDGQAYSADPALWDVIAAFYPSFAREAEAPSGANSFVLDPAGGYDLYAYSGAQLGYAQINHAFLRPDSFSPEFTLVIDAINTLPKLQKVDTVPGTDAAYGLMSVAEDYTKVQYFLYGDVLAVNGTSYAITSPQYKALKAAFSAGTASNNGLVTPQWFVYMNPTRVTKIQCTNDAGQMVEIKAENVLQAAMALRTISTSGVKTYTSGSKDLSASPFKAVYTFDTGVVYTVYVSNDASSTGDVTFYLESSDMDYASEYVCGTYISSYIEYTRESIDGPANPWTM